MKSEGIHHILGIIAYAIAVPYYGISLITKVSEIELFNHITIPVNIKYFFILLVPILFVFIVAILFGNICVAILLLVPHPVLLTLIHNIRCKDTLGRLIGLLNYNGNEPLSKVDKLVKLINLSFKSFIIWRVRPVMIAYLERRRSHDPDTEEKCKIARLIGDLGGDDALIRAMGEEDPNARLGVTDALQKQVEKQGTRVLKKVIKSAYSEKPIVRLSVATVLSNIIRNNPDVIINNPEAESVLAKLKNDKDEQVRNLSNRK